jgi:hypothetical protein
MGPQDELGLLTTDMDTQEGRGLAERTGAVHFMGFMCCGGRRNLLCLRTAFLWLDPTWRVLSTDPYVTEGKGGPDVVRGCVFSPNQSDPYIPENVRIPPLFSCSDRKGSCVFAHPLQKRAANVPRRLKGQWILLQVCTACLIHNMHTFLSTVFCF